MPNSIRGAVALNDEIVLNVAAGKAPMQISTEAAGIPQKAIDGSTSAFFSSDTCSLTKSERVPWWYVNLLEPYMVQLVRLDFGKSCCGKSKTATIVVRVGNNRPDLGTNPICNRFTGTLEEGQPLFLPCNPPMPGAFVSVHLESTAPSQLSICESFVYTDQALPIERCPAFRDQPPGASASYNGKCYIFYSRQSATLRDALAFCRARGGTLINESNPALQGFISWELWRRHRSDTSSQYWMGAVRDAQDRNTWKWIGGEEVSVSFWNLPGGDEDCARYDGSKGWLWSDTNCNSQLNFICQHQPKACGRPEQPPNSTMIAPKGFDVGAVVEYICDEGHLLVGPQHRTCLETGFYNEFPPVCKYIECGLPASVPHGFYKLINGSIGYLSTVMYQCAEGYEMVGRAVLTCDIDERWNGPPPRCESIECDPLPAIFPNGDIVVPNMTVFGSRVEIICKNGYVVDDKSEIICTASGQRALSEKNAARARMLQRETRQNVEHYKRLRTQQTRIFESKKRRFEESDEQLMEQLSQSGKSRQFYKMLKKSQGGFTPNVAMCRDEEGNIFTDEREVIERWKCHFNGHLNGAKLGESSSSASRIEQHISREEDDEVLPPSLEEVTSTIKQLKHKKAAGSDVW
ncbi:uncharacterized protein LOC128729042 [Anopheles nili]|uniref:uncharacterized protein LOC128729042 n=1 Tax=Anopheles nili TaxID=185578 RepID=UPI00237A1791|nr:uncharacterized protein LOC128729042 [Anopheles nili]